MSMQSDDNQTRGEMLIKYLLDEVEVEEKFETERLCNLDSDWRAEKKFIQQSLSLLQHAGRDGFRLDSSSIEILCFSQEEKNQILEKLKNIEPQGKPDDKDSWFKGKLHFWVPLTVAVTALIIAYFGTLERKNKEELILAKVGALKEKIKEVDTASQKDLLINQQSDEIKQVSFLLEDSQDSELSSGIKVLMAEDKLTNGIEQAPQGESTRLIGDETDLPLVSGNKPASSLFKAKILNNQSQIALVNWSSILEAPRAAFLHQENGDALGRVKLMGFSSAALEFKRADWPIKERSFALSRGKYQMRITENTGIIYLLEGKVQRLSSDSRLVSQPKQESVAYEFLLDKAWRLAEDEKRLEVDF